MYHLKRELTIQSLKSKFHNGVDYIQEKSSDFKDNINCLQTRIKMYATLKKMKKYGHLVKRTVNSMDDCFEFMSEPLYGFRTKITSVKSCGTFGLACNNVDETSIVQERQTGEGFRTNDPPDCRIINICT